MFVIVSKTRFLSYNVDVRYCIRRRASCPIVWTLVIVNVAPRVNHGGGQWVVIYFPISMLGALLALESCMFSIIAMAQESLLFNNLFLLLRKLISVIETSLYFFYREVTFITCICKILILVTVE